MALPDGPEGLHNNATEWLHQLEKALETTDAAALTALFLETSYWRDAAALTWDIRQSHGRESVVDDLLSVIATMRPSGFRLDDSKPAPALTGQAPDQKVEIFFTFETSVARCSGQVLAEEDASATSGLRAFTLFTRIEELHDFPWTKGHPRGHGYETGDNKQNWLDVRSKHQAYDDRNPEVLIVGGGHSGLIAAAHFARLGVDALIVDKNERVGDNWRKRYHTLALHNPVEMNHLPYLPFPDNFPQYIPKDKLANWLESYAESLDLNFWTSTEFLGGSFDDEQGVWNVSVRHGGGSTRELHPKHVILATGGVGGLPRIPELEGLSDFAGPVMHSSKFTGGENFAGKKAIVVGVGTSAHDISHDLYNNGAQVTMLQRSPLVVTSLDSANLAYDSYWLTDDSADLIDYRVAAGGIYPLTIGASQGYQRYIAELDRPLHESLEKAGMVLTEGDDKTGWLLKFFREGGGYYLNIGTSEVIAAGGIKLRQASDVKRFVKKGVELNDGTVLEADVVILATGYQNRNSELAGLFGPDLAERIGKIGGFDDVGELANASKPTAQRGLWFMIGSMQQCRVSSVPLVLQVKAELEGLVPDAMAHPAQHRGHSLETVN
ncbi:MAG: Flavin-containing monooxygenase [Subtercola sp.]|nr:Flavin-containing monooxygenase [Subtercola sp.]